MEESSTPICSHQNNFDDLKNSEIYCIKCNTFTQNADPRIVQGENYQLKAFCVVCNSKKNKFLKNKRNKKEKKPKSTETIEGDTPNIDQDQNVI